MVISVGIGVSEDKHDCFIVSSEGEVLANVFSVPNTMDGFYCLLQKIQDCKATGHYSSVTTCQDFLDNGLTTYVLNPLQTNLYQKTSPYERQRPIVWMLV